MTIMHVVGARPNFMKVAPVLRALDGHGVEQILVHTGQHYDAQMSGIFFAQLNLRAPDLNLGVGSGSHSAQTAAMMVGLEAALLAQRPQRVLVYGDVNSTLAAALVGAKIQVPVDHVEAGLRSFDRTMPEEINRVLTDQIADLLFTPSADADANLRREGVDPARIHLVGNVMIDTLTRLLPQADAAWPALRDQLRLGREPYLLVTLHRPANVDQPAALYPLLDTLGQLARLAPVFFPVHPRTRQQLAGWAGLQHSAGLNLLDPLGYLEFLALQRHAAAVITDSGGIQEETTYLGVPCLTLRTTTERPITVSQGTNTLIGHDLELLRSRAAAALAGTARPHRIPPLWDGRAGERIAAILAGR